MKTLSVLALSLFVSSSFAFTLGCPDGYEFKENEKGFCCIKKHQGEGRGCCKGIKPENNATCMGLTTQGQDRCKQVEQGTMCTWTKPCKDKN